MSTVTCPKCGGSLRTRQVDNVLAKFCDHCGSLPFAADVKSGETVIVDRSGQPKSILAPHREAGQTRGKGSQTGPNLTRQYNV